jgi:hypothetical protein
MIGHLHLLWWWALEFAPDGDLTDMDVEDLADGAGWIGDAGTLFAALRDCGPGNSAGFVEELDGKTLLHDWDEYGGRYGRRVESARKAATSRWAKQKANPEPEMRSHSEAHYVADAEERRGEESREDEREPADGEPRRKRRSRMTDDWQPDPEKLAKLRQQFPEILTDVEVPKFRDYWISKGEIRADWDASLRSWVRNAERYRQERVGIQPGGWR